MICQKKIVKFRGKDCHITPIVTVDAKKRLKNAAAAKNYERMAVNGVDLIAKEFKKHDKCYRDYTRVLYDDASKTKELVYDIGNYEAVTQIIEEQVYWTI